MPTAARSCGVTSEMRSWRSTSPTDPAWKGANSIRLLARAAELLFTGRSMSAEEGERWGFFNRLVEPEALAEEARALAASLAVGPTFAHAMTKKMLDQEWDMSVDAAIEAEAQAQAICMQTRDFERAYQAFVDKRRPEFEGD